MYANSVVTILISSWYVLPCIMILCRYLLEYLIYHLRPYGVNMSSHPADHDAVVPKLWQELCDYDLTVQKYCDKKQHKACKRVLEKIEACTWQSRWQIQAKVTTMIWRHCTVTTVIILTGISRDTKVHLDKRIEGRNHKRAHYLWYLRPGSDQVRFPNSLFFYTRVGRPDWAWPRRLKVAQPINLLLCFWQVFIASSSSSSPLHDRDNENDAPDC